MFPVERPPQDRRRRHARAPARFHVVQTVPDEHRPCGVSTQPLERLQSRPPNDTSVATAASSESESPSALARIMIDSGYADA